MKAEERHMTREHALVEQYIWLTKLHRSVVDRRLAVTGVYRSQHQLLMYLSDNPNISQKDLADVMKVSTAAVAVTLKKMEKGGYIRREVDEKDNRYNQICITEKGKQVVEQSRQMFREVEDAMFSGFSSEDYRELEELLGRMNRNLEDYSSEYEHEGAKERSCRS